MFDIVPVFARTLPAAGVSRMRFSSVPSTPAIGSARMNGTPAQGNLRAKTGTMSNIRSLAGYVTTRDGEVLAFAIMADNFEGPGSSATSAIDQIAVRLAGFSRN